MKKELFIQVEELEVMEAPGEWWMFVVAGAVTAATYAGSAIILT